MQNFLILISNISSGNSKKFALHLILYTISVGLRTKQIFTLFFAPFFFLPFFEDITTNAIWSKKMMILRCTYYLLREHQSMQTDDNKQTCGMVIIAEHVTADWIRPQWYSHFQPCTGFMSASTNSNDSCSLFSIIS